MEDAQNGLLQFPQGFLGSNDVHFKRIALGGNALLQLLHSLNEGINYLILLQEDAIIILLQYFDRLFHILRKFQNVLVMIGVVRDACTMLQHAAQMADRGKYHFRFHFLEALPLWFYTYYNINFDFLQILPLGRSFNRSF